jgi:uncharacterized protein with HEPN domain
VTRRSEREWLADIIAWGDRLEGHLSGLNRAGFFASPLIQDATCKCIEAIGEAAGKLDDLAPELDKTAPALNLKLARRMRDRISHGYYNIDLNVLWNTAQTAVPKTVAAAKSMIRKYDDGNSA